MTDIAIELVLYRDIFNMIMVNEDIRPAMIADYEEVSLPILKNCFSNLKYDNEYIYKNDKALDNAHDIGKTLGYPCGFPDFVPFFTFKNKVYYHI
jgi:hypothetical protein